MTRTAKPKPATPPAFTAPAIPPADVLGRLAALKTAATPALKQQWRELFGKEPPNYNRRFLELLDLPDALLAGRPTMSEVILFQQARGDFGPNSELLNVAPMPSVDRRAQDAAGQFDTGFIDRNLAALGATESVTVGAGGSSSGAAGGNTLFAGLVALGGAGGIPKGAGTALGGGVLLAHDAAPTFASTSISSLSQASGGAGVFSGGSAVMSTATNGFVGGGSLFGGGAGGSPSASGTLGGTGGTRAANFPGYLQAGNGGASGKSGSPNGVNGSAPGGGGGGGLAGTAGKGAAGAVRITTYF